MNLFLWNLWNADVYKHLQITHKLSIKLLKALGLHIVNPQKFILMINCHIYANI